MSNHTVCILAAGRGTRMGEKNSFTNKALLPLDEKAAITWIINQFVNDLGDSVQFVIAVGYKADDVKDYLELAHPDIALQFVHVDKFEGPNSGPGHSTLCCESLLQKPFYLCCCDTIWNENLDPKLTDKNWIALKNIGVTESPTYCNIEVKEDLVHKIQDKIKVTDQAILSFTGLASINNYQSFFNGLRNGQMISGELQLSSGFNEIMKNDKLHFLELNSWIDIGTQERYERALNKNQKCNFQKEGEYFYCIKDRVLKFYADSDIVKNRASRARLKPELFPKILKSRNHFFCYQFLAGETFYECVTPFLFNELLNWLEINLWTQGNEKRGTPHFYRE